MTGICGIWHRDGGDASDDCARMRRALKVYGPHREGQWDGGVLSLGIQMFRMLPEDRFDRQPLAGGGGRFVLVADVRLDNRPELAAELGWPDERRRDAADADYVLAAWEKWQDASLDKLIGDWALAVWDAEKHTLTLARDMMGMRPLFYHAGKDFFAFASMAKGLHALPDIPIAPDLDTLRDYLALAPMRGPGWYFKGISRVEPGGKVVLHADGRVEAGLWYDWSRIRERKVPDDAACIEEFRSIFDRAVADRLRTDGRIGSMLSSGCDSTAVAVTAAQMLAKEGKRLAAFTHVPHKGWQMEVPEGRSPDEGPAAAATAAPFSNIDHVLVDSGDRMIGESLDATFYYDEFPMNNICNQVWSDEIARLAQARQVGVLLSGQCGNMSISLTGQERLHELMRKGDLRTWLHEAAALRRSGAMRYRGVLYSSLGPWLPSRLNYALRWAFDRRVAKLSTFSALNPAIAGSRDFRRHLAALGYDPTFRPHVSIRHLAEFVLQRRDHVALYVKGMLARFGVEQRDPTADRRLIEFSLSLPSRMWLRDGRTKWLYRQAFRGRVPDAVMAVKGKGYQGADWPERLMRSKLLLDDEIAAALGDADTESLLDGDFLQRWKENALPALPDGHASTQTHRAKLLRGVSVTHFIRRAKHRN
jgi:asparagine synthase (glutamine-hydrolysing)